MHGFCRRLGFGGVFRLTGSGAFQEGLGLLALKVSGSGRCQNICAICISVIMHYFKVHEDQLQNTHRESPLEVHCSVSSCLGLGFGDNTLNPKPYTLNSKPKP